MRRIDSGQFAGMRVGKWTVIGDDVRENRVTKMLCVCDCGTKKYVNRDSVLFGRSTGCRKCSGMNGANNPAYKGTKNIPGNYWGILKKSAAIRSLPVEITIEDLDKKLVEQGFKCALSGMDISFSGGKKGKKWTASVDRIDSKVGYVYDNIQFVHKDVNLMKNRFDEGYFIDVCQKISVVAHYRHRRYDSR